MLTRLVNMDDAESDPAAELSRLVNTLRVRAGLELTDLVAGDGTLVDRLLHSVVILPRSTAGAALSARLVQSERLDGPADAEPPQWQDTPPECDCWWMWNGCVTPRALRYVGGEYRRVGGARYTRGILRGHGSEGDLFRPIPGGVPAPPGPVTCEYAGVTCECAGETPEPPA